MPTAPLELELLKNVSTWIGSDPTLVQGPGGNTSIKTKEFIWIKASGTRLIDANSKDIFVSLDRTTGLLSPISQHKSSSIETNLHMLIDAPIVIHTHSTSSIAAGFREDLDEIMKDFGRIAFVPYHRPGKELANAIRSIVDISIHDFAILKNHGLLVWGNSVEQVRSNLVHFENRFNELLHYTDSELVEARSILMNGDIYRYLTPDHAVFLEKNTLQELNSDFLKPHWLDEMFTQLSIALACNLKSKKLTWLDKEEVLALRNWEAERDRKVSNNE